MYNLSKHSEGVVYKPVMLNESDTVSVPISDGGVASIPVSLTEGGVASMGVKVTGGN